MNTIHNYYKNELKDVIDWIDENYFAKNNSENTDFEEDDYIKFDFLDKNADRALLAIKDLYLITIENVARANAADYEHVVDYIKANNMINKANYYVNTIYDTYCCTFMKIQDATYKCYLNLVKRGQHTDEDTKEFHDNIVKFDKYANQYVKPISSYKIKIDEELRKRRRPLY